MKKPTAPDSAVVVPIQRPPSHHRRPRRVPVSSPTLDPPADFPMSASARAEWVRIAPSLVMIGVDLSLDRSIVLAYCESVGQLADARAAWEALGKPSTIEQPKLGLRRHPFVALIGALGHDVAKYADALGLSPRVASASASSQ